MKLKVIAVTSVVTLALSACAGNNMGEKQTFGGILGAAGGAVAGAQFGKGNGQLVGVAAGTLLGALIGSEVGKSLDRVDQMAMTRTTQDALESSPSHRPSRWNNPDNGHSGTVTPSPAYTNTNGQYCREFQQTVIVGGEEERAYGTACRQPDGSWQIVNAAATSTPQMSSSSTVVEKTVVVAPPRVRPGHRVSPRRWR